MQNGTTSHKEKADISEAGYIPPNVTCDQALDHSVKKGSVYSLPLSLLRSDVLLLPAFLPALRQPFLLLQPLSYQDFLFYWLA